jgi:co-chaperonin GroES (HSP10)
MRYSGHMQVKSVLRGFVLVRPHLKDEQSTTESGLIVVDFDTVPDRATVVMLGAPNWVGGNRNNGEDTVDFKEGDVVFVYPYLPKKQNIQIDGVEHWILEQKDILAVWEEEKDLPDEVYQGLDDVANGRIVDLGSFVE